MNNCNKFTFWQGITTLGIYGYFKWRNERRKEAKAKAAEKAAEIEAATRSIEDRINGSS